MKRDTALAQCVRCAEATLCRSSRNRRGALSAPPSSLLSSSSLACPSTRLNLVEKRSAATTTSTFLQPIARQKGRTYCNSTIASSSSNDKRSSSIEDATGNDNGNDNGNDKGTVSSAFDFRSDTVTTPTPSMLAALTSGVPNYDEDYDTGTATTTTTTDGIDSSPSPQSRITSPLIFGDDVYSEDTSTASLERRIASLTGHEAGLLVLSGTMANQIAVRTHLSLDRRMRKQKEVPVPNEQAQQQQQQQKHYGMVDTTGRSEGTTVRGPPYSILCDARAHILNYEAGGAAALSGAMVQGVMPQNGQYLTLERDIVPRAVVGSGTYYPSSSSLPAGTATPQDNHAGKTENEHGDFNEHYDDTDIHAAPTALVALENTLNGMIFPLDEMRRIAAWTRRQGIALHLDGARLWEAAAAAGAAAGDGPACSVDTNSTVPNGTYGTTNDRNRPPPPIQNPTLRALLAYASLPDSASLCLSKGLCAPIGTVLVGSERFIRHARRVRKMLGGGVRMAGLVAVPGRVALEEVFLGRTNSSSSTTSKNKNTNNSAPTPIAAKADGVVNTNTNTNKKDQSPGATLRRTHAVVQRLAKFWLGLNHHHHHHHHDGHPPHAPHPPPQPTKKPVFRLLHPPQTNQLWLDLGAAAITDAQMQGYMAREGVRGGGGGRLVVHAQICAEAVRRVERVMGLCLGGKKERGDQRGRGAVMVDEEDDE